MNDALGWTLAPTPQRKYFCSVVRVLKRVKRVPHTGPFRNSASCAPPPPRNVFQTPVQCTCTGNVQDYRRVDRTLPEVSRTRRTRCRTCAHVHNTATGLSGLNSRIWTPVDWVFLLTALERHGFAVGFSPCFGNGTLH